MKKKLLLSSIFTCLIISGTIAGDAMLQTTDSLIKIIGVVTAKDGGKPVEAKLYYEKLPYYDDIGVASSKQGTGRFEMYMVLGNKYRVEVKGDGFEAGVREIIVADEGSGQMTQDFILEPDFDHKSISIENLNFASSRSVISTSSYAGLDAFAAWLEARPNAIVQLEGHTDFQGNADANMKLSQDRVDAVKKYLVDKGIKKNRLRTKAFGGTQPLTRDRSSESRALNRRVEVQIIQQ